MNMFTPDRETIAAAAAVDKVMLRLKAQAERNTQRENKRLEAAALGVKFAVSEYRKAKRMRGELNKRIGAKRALLTYAFRKTKRNERINKLIDRRMATRIRRIAKVQENLYIMKQRIEFRKTLREGYVQV